MMRCLCFLCILSSCLQSSRGIEEPDADGTPTPTHTDVPLVVGVGAGNTGMSYEESPPPSDSERSDPDADPTDNSDTDGITHDSGTEGGTLTVQPPALRDERALSDINVHAQCHACLYTGGAAVELSCEIKGCSAGFTFVKNLTVSGNTDYRSLCGSGDKTVRDLGEIKLKCTFKRPRGWWFDYQHSAELRVSKGIVRAQHLCVVTEEDPLFLNLGSDKDSARPEVTISPKDCNDRELRGKDHRLALTFTWGEERYPSE